MSQEKNQPTLDEIPTAFALPALSTPEFIAMHCLSMLHLHLHVGAPPPTRAYQTAPFCCARPSVCLFFISDSSSGDIRSLRMGLRGIPLRRGRRRRLPGQFLVAPDQLSPRLLSPFFFDGALTTGMMAGGENHCPLPEPQANHRTSDDGSDNPVYPESVRDLPDVAHFFVLLKIEERGAEHD